MEVDVQNESQDVVEVEPPGGGEIVQLRTYVASLMTRLGLPTELPPTLGVDQLRPVVGHLEELLAKRSQSG